MTSQTTAAATAAFLDADSVLHGPLSAEVSMAPVVSGAPVAHERVIADTGEEFFAVWACGVGVYSRVKDKRGSFMYLLEGAGTIVDQDGTAHELSGGSILVLPFGWSGHWNITQTIRKVYVHTTPVPPFRAGVQPSTFVSAGELAAGDRVAFDGPDGVCRVQTTPSGVHRRLSGDSRFTYVIAGKASVTGADGVVRELSAGSAITLPAGWSGTLDVRTPLRTFDVVSTRPEAEHE